jgi:hypothetical protein
MKTSFVRKVSDVESVPCRLVERSCYRRGSFSRASMIDQSTLQRDKTNYDVQNQSEN